MKEQRVIRLPVQTMGARYRWDTVRDQHQLVFPEGMIVLNATSAAIVRLCDGRSTDDLISTLKGTYPGSEPADDVHEFLRDLADRGVLRDETVD